MVWVMMLSIIALGGGIIVLLDWLGTRRERRRHPPRG